MSGQDLELKLVMKADGSGLVGTVKVTKKEIQQLSTSMDQGAKAGKKLEKTLDKTGKKVDYVGMAAQRAGTMVAGYFSARMVFGAIRSADAFAVLQQRIETATKATGDYLTVSDQIHTISQRNGTALSETVSLFQSLARAAPELEATNDEMLTLTNLVQQLGVIGGSSKAGMSAGMLQFSQAMSAGVVRAEEMNSLLENVPELAVRIAHGMNMTVGELRSAVLAGRVLSKEVYQALIKQAPEINREFEGITPALSRAWTTLGNTMDRVLGKLNEATGITSGMATFINDMAKGADNWTDYLAPTGRAKFNQLIGSREEIKETLGKLQKIVDKSFFPRAFVNKRIRHLKGALKTVNAEIEKRQDAKIAQMKKGSADDGQPKQPKAIALDKGITQWEQKLQSAGATVGQTASETAKLNAEFRINNEIAEALAKKNTVLAKQWEDARPRIMGLVDAHNKKREAIEEEAIRAGQLWAVMEQGNRIEEQSLQAHNERLKSNQNLLVSMTDEMALTKLGNKERYIEIRLRQLSAEATSEQVLQVQALAGKLYDAEEAQKQSQNGFKEMRQAVEGWNRSFADAMLNSEQGFEGFVDSLIQQMMRISIAKATEPFFNAFAASFSGGGASANDASYSTINNDGMVVNLPTRQYATGGIVNSPQIRVVGETYQPEAVVPLPDGRAIPVQMQGGSRGPQAIQVEIINNGSPQKIDQAQPHFDGERMILQVFTSDLQRAGPMSQQMAGVFNLRRGGG